MNYQYNTLFSLISVSVLNFEALSCSAPWRAIKLYYCIIAIFQINVEHFYLLKTFGTINQELLITKFHTYSFDEYPLKIRLKLLK